MRCTGPSDSGQTSGPDGRSESARQHAHCVTGMIVYPFNGVTMYFVAGALPLEPLPLPLGELVTATVTRLSALSKA